MRNNLLRAFSLALTLVVLAPNAYSQSGEKLQYAVVVSRHGVRSPTWTADRLNQYSSAAWPEWGVAPGELTVHGRELMKIMGTWYRAYFESLGLPNLDCKTAFFRADSAQRTLVTAQALAEGIAQGCRAEIRSLDAGKADFLFEGAGGVDPALSMAAVSARLGKKPDAFADAHRTSLDLLAHLLSGSGKAAQSIFEEPVSLTGGKSGVAMNGPMSLASTLTEDFFLEYSNGMSGDRLGWGRLTQSNLLELMSLHTAYAEMMRRTPYLARSRGSNLLNYVVESLARASTNPATKLLVISGHDTNLSNLSGMLGLSWLLPGYQPDDAPPGGALVFTLWQAPVTGKYSVRLQFVAQTPDQMHDGTALSLAHPPAMTDVFVPGCSSAAPGYPCDWDAFLATAHAAILPGFVSQ